VAGAQEMRMEGQGGVEGFDKRTGSYSGPNPHSLPSCPGCPKTQPIVPASPCGSIHSMVCPSLNGVSLNMSRKSRNLPSNGQKSGSGIPDSAVFITHSRTVSYRNAVANTAAYLGPTAVFC
jgi:hypothetical protein